MSLANEKREVCPLHGWVGRRAFTQERHDLCEPPEGATSYTFDSEDAFEETDEDADEEMNEGTSTDGSEEEEEALPLEIVKPAREEDLAEEDPSEGDTPQTARSLARRNGIPSKKTLAVRRITRLELATGRAELEELGAELSYERPRTRGDCAQVARPCRYVACKYHLYLDVSKTGSIILNFPHLEPGDMPPDQSCALDLAERGPLTLEHIALVTNLTRERIRQVEQKALTRKGREAAEALGLGPENTTKSSKKP